MSQIKLECSDGEIFAVDLEVANYSSTIKQMLEILGADDGDEEVVRLPNVDSATLKKIIEWVTYHKENPPDQAECSDCEQVASTGISPWDEDFLNVDRDVLFDLIMAANYLDIKPLLIVTCKYIAYIIEDKTPEEIREILNIRNDFSDSEDEEEGSALPPREG